MSTLVLRIIEEVIAGKMQLEITKDSGDTVTIKVVRK